MPGLRVCADGYFTIEPGRLGLADTAVLRTVADVQSDMTKPDDVGVMADERVLGSASAMWTNTTGRDQSVWVVLGIGPRALTVSAPNTIRITDYWDYAVGEHPSLSTAQRSLGDYSIHLEPHADVQDGRGVLFDAIPDRYMRLFVGTVKTGEQIVTAYDCGLSVTGRQSQDEAAPDQYAADAFWARIQIWASPTIGVDDQWRTV